MRVELEIPDDAEAGRFGVYVLRDADGVILYIGHTQNLYGRLHTHRSLKPWWRDVRSLEWVACQGYSEARATEKQFIALFAPEFNEADIKPLPSPRKRARTPELPDWTVAKLIELREAEADAAAGNIYPREALDSYILSLRNAKWSLEVIGRGLGMTRERVRQRQARATHPLKGAAVPQVPAKVVRPKKVKPSIPADVLAELRNLQVFAREVRGWTPLDDPRRAASVNFTELIAEQYLSGVSIYRISQQLGVTHLAIRARLARHGYLEPIKGLPNNTAYGTPWRGPSQKTECKVGHPLSGDNLRVIRKSDGASVRVCKTCDRRRGREYLQRKKVGAA